VTCATVIASFVIFAVGQTSTASTHQQVQLAAGADTASTGTAASGGAPPHRTSTLHRVIDQASERLTSPFAAILPASSSEWVVRTLNLILALAVYGFALGFIARWFRVRA
jgi:hypothetical protein